jgi:AAA+ ATPase superfamily predicted ATPase
MREVPVTEKRLARSRNSLYYLADNYLDFWYRFVDPARSLIAQGMGLEVWERIIDPALHKYVSRPTFERACRDYLWRSRRKGELPVDLQFTEVGTWWGAEDREIDVVALDINGSVCAAGSCKWTNEPMDVREYNELQKDLILAGLEGNNPFLFLFSRSGFTQRLEEVASRQQPQRLFLISLDKLYSG